MGLFDKLKEKMQNSEQRTNHKNLKYADSSSIPENERCYYEKDEYYELKPFEGTPFEYSVISFDERKKTSFPSKRGLYVPEILMLSFCSDYPCTNNKYPGYWWFKYGVRNVGALIKSLETRGFISINVETGKYELTDLGNSEQNDNEYVAYTHRNSDLTTFTPWELNQMINNDPMSDWKKIFAEKTGKPVLSDEEIKNIVIFDPKAKKQEIRKRVPLSKIKNRNNFDQGYIKGSPFYYKGEQYRKAGDLYKAIEQYDEARFNGMTGTALYYAYDKAFRKMKDYENDIDILEEACSRYKNSPEEVEGFNKLLEKAKKALEKQNA